jgi:ribosomal protein S18 acetylase RimI-like enzyme
VLEIRPYRESDEAAVRRICLLTGDDGGDATALYTDVDLVSDIFAVPYTVFDPGLCFVAVDGGRVLGYIVGTADSARFDEQFGQLWLPRVAGRHQDPPPARPDPRDDPQGALAWRLHHPGSDPRVLGDYPAHLHVDLLPEAQGRGCGRALMMRFLAAAAGHGAQGVHLHVSLTNTGARAFYAKLGFAPLVLPGDEARAGSLLVRPTAVDPASPAAAAE